MSLAPDMLRGNTDTIILAHLLVGDSYGYEINKSIRRLSDGEFELKEATLYTSFRRLEQDGCIRSYWGSEETGARRRYYAITDTGQSRYRALLTDWEHAKTLLDRLLNTETLTSEEN